MERCHDGQGTERSAGAASHRDAREGGARALRAGVAVGGRSATAEDDSGRAGSMLGSAAAAAGEARVRPGPRQGARPSQGDRRNLRAVRRILAWSYLSPVSVNPGADGIFEALEKLGPGKAGR